nr:putative reverse transcriptase domain-containing protein [Tanacetum cinerariifolium]
MIEDFDNIGFGQIMTMAVSEHFLHTKPSIDSEEFMNVFMRIGFGSAIKLVSFDESQMVTFNSKFICGFRNGDCKTGSQSDNTIGIPHRFIIYWILILKNIKKVTEVFDVKIWRIDNSRVLRWIISLIEWNSYVSSMKSSIQSAFNFGQMGSAAYKIASAAYMAAPFEALYDRKCRSPVCWNEVGEFHLTGPELVQETTEKIVHIKHRMQAAQDHQKSYADLKRKPMEFQVGDKVMLKVLPWKGVVRFGKRGKLNPRYVGPFKVIERVGSIAYKLELLEELSRVYNTFHVSNLKKCYANEPNNHVPIVKVRWNSRRGPEFTWEREDQFKKKYPHLFTKTAPSSNAA